jgi:hypothetical protein
MVLQASSRLAGWGSAAHISGCRSCTFQVCGWLQVFAAATPCCCLDVESAVFTSSCWQHKSLIMTALPAVLLSAEVQVSPQLQLLPGVTLVPVPQYPVMA